MVTLDISFDFDFVGEIEEIVDERTYKIRPVGVYTEENEVAFQEKVGISMKPFVMMPEERIVLVRRSNRLILRPDPGPTAISRSVMENGLLVSSESAARGIPGKDVFSDSKLSVNVFTADALFGDEAERNINTLFYEAAGGVFPISIERKGNPVKEIVEADILQKEEMHESELERVGKFIEKELNERKPMFEHYAARNMLVVGTYPFLQNTAKANPAHEERAGKRIAADCFRYVFYAKGFADRIDRSVRPGVVYREVEDVVKKTIKIPTRYFFYSSDKNIAPVLSSMSTCNLEISVPDYEGSLKREQLDPGTVYFSHVVRL
ncbi:MAG: hypothetical protein NC254_04505 [bacterium]|nr:hypothetical protein [bacterium]